MELEFDKALESMKFNVGMVYLTRGVDTMVREDKAFSKFVGKSFARHVNGDWGDLCDEDKELNEMALLNGDDRLFSRYEFNGGEYTIYIITEWDRSATTILFTDEY